MRRFLIILAVLCGSVAAFATDLASGFYTPLVAIDFLPGYEYNRNWGSVGNFDFKASVPLFGPYFEVSPGLRLSTANVYTLNVIARPRIPLRVGEIFFEAEPSYRLIARDRTHDVTFALSGGYRFDYLSFQLGWFGRWMMPFSGGGSVEELNNVLYKVRVFCRPQASDWNLYLTISNIDDFMMERMQIPMFMLEGRYDFGGFLRLTAGIEYKVSGMMHITTAFYGISARVGAAFIIDN